MKYAITFTKASGAGNDFVIVDNMTRRLPLEPAQLARIVCSRPFGIGADGLLVLEPGTRGDFAMKYFNADGSYGGMCGNGGRCIARYAFLHGIAPQSMTFEALDYLYRAEVENNRVKLSMKNPSGFRRNVRLTAPFHDYTVHFINTGSPHAVTFIDNLESVDVARAGAAIRHDPAFAPEGTNANFVCQAGKGVISLRTYERGVEAETMACGTGSVASAIIWASLETTPSPVRVQVRSGEDLIVHFDRNGEEYTNIILEGSAHMLFTGQILIDSTSLTISVTE